MHCGFPPGGGGRARLYITRISSGGEGRDGRAARQAPSGSFLHKVIGSPRRTKQKGAFRPKEEKDITLLLLNVSFSFPGLGSLPHARIGENSISPTAADLGFFFNYCWGTVNFSKQTNHSKANYIGAGCHVWCNSENEMLCIPMCACVRGREPESVCVGGFI